MIEIAVPEDAEGMRLDRFLRKSAGPIGQGLLERQLRQGKIRLDGAKAKANTRLQSGQRLTYPEQLIDSAANGQAKSLLSRLTASLLAISWQR